MHVLRAVRILESVRVPEETFTNIQLRVAVEELHAASKLLAMRADQSAKAAIRKIEAAAREVGQDALPFEE
jgi:hypothetical protein